MFLLFYLIILFGISLMNANTPTDLAQVVIFDLGGVLLNEAESNLHKADSFELKSLLANEQTKIKIFNRAFEFAALFYDYDCKKAWILGHTSGQEIVDKIKNNIDHKDYDYFFKNNHERELIKHGIEFVLLPDLLVGLTSLILEGLEFLKDCQNSNIELAIISNWDPASFALLKAKFPELFILFKENNIIIPKQLGQTKPAPEIYDHAIKKIKYDLANCFFVDDSQANIIGAQKYGIKSVHHKNWLDTKQKLKELGLKINK